MTEDTTRIRLIRHAPTDTGPAPGRLCGWLDLPVSPRGRQDLQRLQALRADVSRPRALYTSPLLRARDTARALGEAWRLEPQIDAGLSEINCGHLEGRWIVEIQREQPELWALNEAQSDDGFTWPGGESYRQFRGRVLAALQRIAQRHPAQEVAIVSHTGAITQIVGTLLGRPPAQWQHHLAKPLSATVVLWAQDSPHSLVSFNEVRWWQ